MKKIIFTLITVLMATQSVQADVVINEENFPDYQFRGYIHYLYPSGVITDAELQARTTLDIAGDNE